MSSPVGFMGHLGIRRESSFASGGSVDNWQPFTSETITLNYNHNFTDSIQNTAEQIGTAGGTKAVNGNISFDVSPQNPMEWWTCGLGQASTPFYVQRNLPSLLLQIDRETAAVQVSGCMIGSMTLSSAQGDVLKASVDIEAAGMGSVAAGSPSFASNDAPYRHEEASFVINDTNDTSITAWSVTINNNLVTDLYGNQVQRLDIPAGKLAVTGSFTKLFDDTTERNAFLNNQVRSFKATFARQGASLIVLCPKIKYSTHPENISGQSAYILEIFNWTGYVDNPATENSIRISGDNVL